MRRHRQADPIPSDATQIRAGYDETLGVYAREPGPGSARRDGQPGYEQPLAVYFARQHADHGWRDEIHLSVDDARWLAGELLHRIRSSSGVTLDTSMAAALLEDVADDLTKVRTRLLDLSRGLGQP